MKAERRHELQENSLVRGVRNFPELWRDYGSKVLLAVILALLAAVLVKTWLGNREQTRQATAEQLTAARVALEQYRRGEAGAAVLAEADPGSLSLLQMFGRSTGGSSLPVSLLAPESAAKVRKDVWSKVEQAAADVLKNSTDPARQAEATLLRADANLHWAALATFAESPDAATRPALGVGGKPDEYLGRAADGYEQLVKQSGNVPARLVAAARMGLAAVHENRSNFAGAREQYELVRKDGPDPTIQSLAEARLQLLTRLPTNPLIGAVKSAEPTTGPATTGRPPPRRRPRPQRPPPLRRTSLRRTSRRRTRRRHKPHRRPRRSPRHPRRRNPQQSLEGDRSGRRSREGRTSGSPFYISE
jgi:type II secretory pathway pseudopilin PulG